MRKVIGSWNSYGALIIHCEQNQASKTNYYLLVLHGRRGLFAARQKWLAVKLKNKRFWRSISREWWRWPHIYYLSSILRFAYGHSILWYTYSWLHHAISRFHWQLSMSANSQLSIFPSRVYLASKLLELCLAALVQKGKRNSRAGQEATNQNILLNTKQDMVKKSTGLIHTSSACYHF